MFSIKFLFAFTALLGCLALAQTASTTNGRLLKFFPITKDQYKAFLRLAKQQSAVPEDSIVGSHRSLADWSNTLHSSWNSLFNANKISASAENVNKQYPMCVIRSPEVRRRKRSTLPLTADQSYVGVAPTVVYPGSPYPYPYPVADDADNNEDNIDIDLVAHPSAGDTDSSFPTINCVVVVRRKKQSKPLTNNQGYSPQYPYYPYPYPLPAYPPYPYPYPSLASLPAARSNNLPVVDPLAAVNYQRMLAEYYKHLQALYTADATSTGEARSAYQADDEDDDKQNDDDANDDSFEDEN